MDVEELRSCCPARRGRGHAATSFSCTNGARRDHGIIEQI
uniref:Uncharacterized protein n=1 Tax=Arundo donax TaxID=35708 RepID=A0A0A8ZYQ5_ARUDO